MAYHNFYAHTLLVLVSLLVLNSPYVRGRNLKDVKRKDSSPTEETVRTIKDNNGDVVDCVDIYKQPTLNHPLLKDHKIQMDPSSSPRSKTNGRNSHKTSYSLGIRMYANVVAFPSTETRFYGGGGQLSVWNPAVLRAKDYSASSLIVVLSETAMLSAGWIVNPGLYGDFQTRFFIYWTTDDSINTGCYDLHCEGFVQVNKRVDLGAAMESISTIGAKSHLSLRILIFLDRTTGNWWLRVGGEAIEFGLQPSLPTYQKEQRD
ncbi:uncharacterized protein LOC110715645 [Chenopodium quinoa]|uniref:uncharacterized protein LOC110715645 n=1 Tax=Chenopodium quinoa TaxID=63459 RepID=UPI000B76DFB5|nr:uncharacterized protein LOC110715645 [Chenopodium quinoa]